MAGLYYEDLTPGLVIEHAIRRTVTEMDNVLFSAHDLQLRAAAHRRGVRQEHHLRPAPGQQHVPARRWSCGIVVVDTTHGTTLGNLGFEEVKFPKPVFHGDTIHVRTEVLDRRESKKRTDSGIVFFQHIGSTSATRSSASASATGLMLKRPVDRSQRRRCG